MHFEQNELHALYSTTMHRLERMRLRVREGVRVDDANDFARYVMNSQMVDIFRSQQKRDPHIDKIFPIDPKKLWDTAYELYQACCDYYTRRTRHADGTPTGPQQSDIEQIRESLNAINVRLGLETFEPKVVSGA
jgi:hypothetical protein